MVSGVECSELCWLANGDDETDDAGELDTVDDTADVWLGVWLSADLVCGAGLGAVVSCTPSLATVAPPTAALDTPAAGDAGEAPAAPFA